MVLGVCEPNKGKVISSEGFWRRETLDWRFVLNIVKISCVIVAGKFVYDGRYIVSNCPEVPVFVLEEGMIDDVINPFVAQSVLSMENDNCVLQWGSKIRTN